MKSMKKSPKQNWESNIRRTPIVLGLSAALCMPSAFSYANASDPVAGELVQSVQQGRTVTGKIIDDTDSTGLYCHQKSYHMKPLRLHTQLKLLTFSYAFVTDAINASNALFESAFDKPASCPSQYTYRTREHRLPADNSRSS